jgi:phage/plasmid-associated DNA primase
MNNNHFLKHTKSSIKNDDDLIYYDILSTKYTKENDKRLFQIDNKTEYNLIKKDTMTKDYINDIIMLLCKNIKFDISPSHEIHFKNGYYDLKLKTFYKRTNKHFITRYINRNYENPNSSLAFWTINFNFLVF